MNIPLIDKFPADVLILQKRGAEGGLIAYKDKGRFKRKGTEEFYEFKKNHKKLKPPSYSFMIPQSNGRPMVIFYEYARGMYVPVDTAHLEAIPERDKNGSIVMEDCTGDDGTPSLQPKINRVINLKAADEDMSQWAGVFRRQADEKYKKKSFMDKYWPFILLSMMLVAVIVLAWIFMQSISDTGMGVVDALNNVAAKMNIPAVKPPG